MYTGLTGKVMIGEPTAAEIAYISNWSVEDTVELIEVSELGKRAKDKVAGFRGWTASADGAIEFGTDGTSGHKALFDAMHEGKKVKCEFYLNKGVGSEPAVKFSGTGMIESLSIDLSAEDKGNISISLSGVDELVYPGKV